MSLRIQCATGRVKRQCDYMSTTNNAGDHEALNTEEIMEADEISTAEGAK